MIHRRDDTDQQAGAIARALLWVVGGMLLFAVAVGLTAPELVAADVDILRDILGIVLVAAVPGIVLLAVAAFRRRRLGLDDEDPPATGWDDAGLASSNGDRPAPPDDRDGRS